MTGKKHEDGHHSHHGHHNHSGQPDDIQRALWHHWRIVLVAIVVLVAARFILPHIPLLKGWEQKFSGGAIEIGKGEIPSDAVQTGTLDGARQVFEKPETIQKDMFDLNGPVLIAAWKCTPAGEAGTCLRYIWKGEPLTLVTTTHTKRFNKTNGPFSRTGWGGYFIVQKSLAAALVGPFDPTDLLNIWPYAVKFSNKKH